MNESLKVLILFVAGIIGSTGMVLLISAVISVLPGGLLIQFIIGVFFIVFSMLIGVLIRRK